VITPQKLNCHHHKDAMSDPLNKVKLVLVVQLLRMTCLESQCYSGMAGIELQGLRRIFTARCYASAILAMDLCLCLSVTSRCSTKTAKRRITQTTPHDTAGSLVFWCQRSQRNSTGVTPYEGAECRWGGQNRRLSTNNQLYLENGKDRHIVSIKVE